jgi:hypothetical protein
LDPALELLRSLDLAVLMLGDGTAELGVGGPVF